MATPQRICTRCVMDTSDPEIEFDACGVCNHCSGFDAMTPGTWMPGEAGSQRLQQILSRIRSAGRGQDHDCALGLSGGVDSCYVALNAHRWGLRPLVVHIDTGWNSDASVSNIERLVKHCGFELHTIVVDWEEMRDLQLAYLRSGVPNQDVPQDHAIFAGLYSFCVRNRMRWILSGGNVATEGIFPRAWHGSAMDSINLRAIHNRFGHQPLRSFPLISFWRLYLIYPVILRMRTVRPLNFMPYDREQAIKELSDACGWRAYGRKHGESRFTSLFQNYYLPLRFDYDKRKPHLSSMIASGQLTRDEALSELAKPLYRRHELDADIDSFCTKLAITRSEFEDFVRAPRHHHSEFPTWDKRYRMAKRLQGCLEKLIRRPVNVYK